MKIKELFPGDIVRERRYSKRARRRRRMGSLSGYKQENPATKCTVLLCRV
jgi:hypothetical protein